MARYALIYSGRVRNVVIADADWPGLADADQAVALADGQACAVGYTYDGSAFTPPPRWETLPEAKAALRRMARVKRIEVEAAGIVVGAQSYPVATDIEARQRLRELKDWSDDNPTLDVEFELADGRVLSISRAQFLVAAGAVRAHVRACAAALQVKATEIEALTSVNDAATYADGQLFVGWPA